MSVTVYRRVVFTTLHADLSAMAQTLSLGERRYVEWGGGLFYLKRISETEVIFGYTTSNAFPTDWERQIDEALVDQVVWDA